MTEEKDKRFCFKMESLQGNKQKEALCVTLKLFDSCLSHLYVLWLGYNNSVCKTLIKCCTGTCCNLPAHSLGPVSTYGAGAALFSLTLC